MGDSPGRAPTIPQIIVQKVPRARRVWLMYLTRGLPSPTFGSPVPGFSPAVEHPKSPSRPPRQETKQNDRVRALSIHLRDGIGLARLNVRHSLSSESGVC